MNPLYEASLQYLECVPLRTIRAGDYIFFPKCDLSCIMIGNTLDDNTSRGRLVPVSVVDWCDDKYAILQYTRTFNQTIRSKEELTDGVSLYIPSGDYQILRREAMLRLLLERAALTKIARFVERNSDSIDRLLYEPPHGLMVRKDLAKFGLRQDDLSIEL